MNTVIITLSWNGTKNTVKLLRSLSALNLPYPIWVIDNGSTDDDTPMFIEACPNVSVFRLGENYGFAGGLNRAVKLATNAGFDYVYEINNDCLVDSDAISPCLKIAMDNPLVAIVGSRYLSKGPDGDYSIWGFHSHPGEQPTFPNGFLVTDRVVGCGMLLRCATYAEFGGMDESFFCYGEENDLCWRINDRGLITGICFGSLIRHNHQGSDVSSNAIYYRTRNLMHMRRKHPNRVLPFSALRWASQEGWQDLLHSHFNQASAYGEGLFAGSIGTTGKRNKPFPVLCGILLLVLYSVILGPALCFSRLSCRIRK